MSKIAIIPARGSKRIPNKKYQTFGKPIYDSIKTTIESNLFDEIGINGL